MYKAITFISRIAMYFLLEVAIYCAWVDPILRVLFRVDDNPLLCIIGWAMLIPIAYAEEHFLRIYKR